MTVTAQSLRILAAGSLRGALGEILRRHAPAATVMFGPAGLLRERIEGGTGFDLFLSADMDHPRRLEAQGLATGTTCFARNRLVAVARASLGLDAHSLLDAMADPAVRLGMSTRGADPSGDYAMQFLDRAERRFPSLVGLSAKALPLVGGPDSPVVPMGVPAAAHVIGMGRADIFIGYATGARALGNDTAFAVIALPGDLAPVPEYGLCRAQGEAMATQAFRDHLLGTAGQDILAGFGFDRA